MYYIAPRLGSKGCDPSDPSACADASTVSKVMLWTSAVIYLIGIFVAYGLGPILTTVDKMSQ